MIINFNKKGFGLLETIVAIGILSMGAGAIVLLLVQSLATTSVSQSRLVAAHLSQEGLEVVRNIRDSNWIQGLSWDDGIPASADLNVDYDSDKSDLDNKPDGLSFDGSFYTHSVSPNTSFERHLEISYPTDGEGIQFMKVKSIVRWSEKERDHEFIGETWLYDWQ